MGLSEVLTKIVVALVYTSHPHYLFPVTVGTLYALREGYRESHVAVGQQASNRYGHPDGKVRVYSAISSYLTTNKFQVPACHG